MARGALLEHLHDPSGRPDLFRRGYMRIYNPYEIHRRGLAERSVRDVAWFVYGHSVHTLLAFRNFLLPRDGSRQLGY